MSISTRSAIAFSIAVRYVSLLAQFGSTMVLARLLTPEDIGIYSAGFSVVALAHLFRDFGLNQYLIQESNLDRDKVATTFTLTLCNAWMLGALLYFAAGPVAAFFNEPGIEDLLHLLCINFFIIPFGSVTLALLRKNLRFHVTAVIGLTSTLVGVAVSIWTALEGARYFCLAYGAIAESGTLVLLSLFFRPPDMPLSLGLRNSRQIFRFGLVVGVGNIVTRVAISGTDALVARLLGMSALGFFSRAFGTFSLFDRIFVSSIRGTILPLFSRDQHNQERLVSGYLRALDYSLVFAWPFFAFLLAFTADTILLLYGDQWGDSVPLARILCLGGFLLPPILFSDNLFIACGRPDITLRIRVIANLSKLALVAAGATISLAAVCYGIVGYVLIKLLVSMPYLRSRLHLDWPQMLRCCGRALPCLAGAIVPPLLANALLEGHIEHLATRMGLLAILTFCGWLAGLHVSRHPFCEELFALYRKLSLPGFR